MVPVLTIVALIEAVTALISITGKTIVAVDKLKNGKPEEVDVAALKQALLELPDLTELFPPDVDDKNIDK
jgi:hypothetical protein